MRIAVFLTLIVCASFEIHIVSSFQHSGNSIGYGCFVLLLDRVIIDFTGFSAHTLGRHSQLLSNVVQRTPPHALLKIKSEPDFRYPARVVSPRTKRFSNYKKKIRLIRIIITFVAVRVGSLRLSMTSVGTQTFQTMVDDAEAGSTIILKKGTYQVEGTLRINKALTIQAESGCAVEVTPFCFMLQSGLLAIYTI
jgi:hypothetical protein